MQLTVKKEENQRLARKFHLTNKEHQKLFNESIILNGLVHKKKQNKIKKIQKIEKKKYKELLKQKENEFKEEIQEKLRQTGIFIPGINTNSPVDTDSKLISIKSTKLANQKISHFAKPIKTITPKNQMISELISEKKQENDMSRFYVNYEGSESNCETLSEESHDYHIEKRLQEMGDQKIINENIKLKDDFDQISLDMDDPKTFTLGKNNNLLDQFSPELSYVDQQKMRIPSNKTNKNMDNWKKKKVKIFDNGLSGSIENDEIINDKRWSEADSFSADSEEGKGFNV